MGEWGCVPGASATLTSGWRVEILSEVVKLAALEVEARGLTAVPPSPGDPSSPAPESRNRSFTAKSTPTTAGNSAHFSRELSLRVSRGPLGLERGLEEKPCVLYHIRGLRDLGVNPVSSFCCGLGRWAQPGYPLASWSHHNPGIAPGELRQFGLSLFCRSLSHSVTAALLPFGIRKLFVQGAILCTAG